MDISGRQPLLSRRVFDRTTKLNKSNKELIHLNALNESLKNEIEQIDIQIKQNGEENECFYRQKQKKLNDELTFVKKRIDEVSSVIKDIEGTKSLPLQTNTTKNSNYSKKDIHVMTETVKVFNESVAKLQAKQFKQLEHNYMLRQEAFVRQQLREKKQMENDLRAEIKENIALKQKVRLWQQVSVGIRTQQQSGSDKFYDSNKALEIEMQDVLPTWEQIMILESYISSIYNELRYLLDWLHRNATVMCSAITARSVGVLKYKTELKTIELLSLEFNRTMYYSKFTQGTTDDDRHQNLFFPDKCVYYPAFGALIDDDISQMFGLEIGVPINSFNNLITFYAKKRLIFQGYNVKVHCSVEERNDIVVEKGGLMYDFFPTKSCVYIRTIQKCIDLITDMPYFMPGTKKFRLEDYRYYEDELDIINE